MTVSGDVTFGNNANGSVTLSIPQVWVPMPQGQAPVPATGYYWTLPAGWKFASFGNTSTSDGSTPVLLNNPGAYSILVTPSGDTGGRVTVRAADTSCGFNNPTSTVSSVSPPASTTVTRTVPTLSIATDTQLPNPLTCGDKRDFGFRAEASNVPFGGSFPSYSWAATNGWSVPNPAAQRPGILPSGNSRTTVTLSAIYSRNSFSTAVAASDKIIDYTSQVATPVFTQFGDLCLGSTRRFAVAPVPGAVSYTWRLPAYFPAPTTITTTGPELLVTAPTTTGSIYADIQVTANVGGVVDCPGGTAIKTVNAGGLAVRITTPYGLPTEICPNTAVTYVAALTGVPQTGTYYPLTYTWTVDGNVVTQGPSESITVLSPTAGQWMSIRVDVATACSRPTFAAVGLQSVSRLSNGLYCVDDFGGFRAAAYPNPAAAELTVALPAGARGNVRLLSGQGRVLRQAAAQGRRTVLLDVRTLPEGLYVLEVPGPQGPTRQQVRVQH